MKQWSSRSRKYRVTQSNSVYSSMWDRRNNNVSTEIMLRVCMQSQRTMRAFNSNEQKSTVSEKKAEILSNWSKNTTNRVHTENSIPNRFIVIQLCNMNVWCVWCAFIESISLVSFGEDAANNNFPLCISILMRILLSNSN